MRILVIANEKGGVAKTTTSINLATALGRLNKPVLLIDMDDQGSSTSVLLNEHPEPNIYTLLRDRKRQVSVEDAIYETSESMVYSIPASPHLAGAEVEFAKYVDNQRLLLRRLQDVERAFSFDYIIIDSPPRSRFLNFNCLFAADEVIVPLFTDLFSIEGIVDLTEDIASIAQSRNRRIDVRFLLCRVERTRSAQRVTEELRLVYSDQVFETVIPKNVTVSDAHDNHTSVITYDARSSGAQAYMQLAKEVLSYYGQESK